jgi:2-haloacid dehalogenase
MVSITMNNIKALIFDTFGTVVDWRTTLIRELTDLGREKTLQIDWAAFTDAWRAGYAPGMERIRQGQRPWANIDVVHRERLEDLLSEFGVRGLTEIEKDRVTKLWHRLDPWPDSVGGLHRLKKHFIISTFSNGSFPCLVNMAKLAGLPWDCIFSADMVRHYKPDPETYRGVIDLLDLSPNEILLVAAHNYDLRHGRIHGMRTAYVNRPTEHGPNQTTDISAEEDWDIVVNHFEELADKLVPCPRNDMYFAGGQ